MDVSTYKCILNKYQNDVLEHLPVFPDYQHYLKQIQVKN